MSSTVPEVEPFSHSSTAAGSAGSKSSNFVRLPRIARPVDRRRCVR
jgi:hypothetical protein